VVARATEFAERKHAQSVDHAEFKVEKHRAGRVIAAQYLVPIWLPHWPACMCTISREEAACRRRAREKNRAVRS
jgi:membrane protein YqaA with SNARE-associated domain